MNAAGLALNRRTPAIAQPFPTIRVGATNSDGSKALFYGKSSGIFQKSGLNVEITIINNGAAGMAGVLGGTLDTVTSSVLGVCQAYLRNVPLQFIVPANLYNTERPAVLLLVKTDSPVRTGADLSGKILASASLKDLFAAAAFAWIDDNGGDHRNVRNVELPQAGMLSALDTGRVDAATVASPFLEPALASGKVRVLAKSLDAIAPHFQISGYVSSGEAVERNVQLFRRFAQAMHTSSQYTNSHLEQTVALVASYSGIDPNVIARSVRAIDAEFLETRYIQPVIDAAGRADLLDRRFEASSIISSVALRPRPDSR
jgi:NitT/TauT family transport system substrate-binding protein